VLISEAYFCELDDKSLSHDLAQLRKIYNIDRILSTSVNTIEMVNYYQKTTDYDYKILQYFKGPGLHSTLNLKTPIGKSACTSIQPIMILERVSRFNCKSVLEVGCGHGFCTLFLANLSPQLICKGIDVVPRHVEIAKKYSQLQFYQNTEFKLCDACNMDAFQDEKFDLIFSVEALCHLDTHQKRNSFLTHAYDRLGDNGIIIIIDGFRSLQFSSCSEHQQMAMRLAEKGFRIKMMPTKKQWIEHANDLNFKLIEDTDLTTEVLPFWTQGWRMAHFILNFAYCLKCISLCFPCTKESFGNFLSVCATAHAFRQKGTAEYGIIMFQKKSRIFD